MEGLQSVEGPVGSLEDRGEGERAEDNGGRRFEIEKRGQIIGLGLVAGIIIGTVVGAVTDNVGFWIAIGTGIGLLVGAVIAARRESQKGEE